MVRRGYFKQYQARIDRDESSTVEDGKRKPVKGRITKIHVILGGPAYGGSIHGAKANLKEVRHQVNYNNTGQWLAPPTMPSVAFTSEDANEIIYPHDDPLVVSLQI